MRPTFLLAEPEPELALSARKLVIETAKFNVITVHSWTEAREAFAKFPGVDAVIATQDIDSHGSCSDFASWVKEQKLSTPFYVLAPNDFEHCSYADERLSSHNPEEVVRFLRSRYGDPRKF